MCWKRFRVARPAWRLPVLFGLLLTGFLHAEPPVASAAAPSAVHKKVIAVDADDNTLVLNPPGLVCLIFCTNEDSQNIARKAGHVVYPFQGRPDFQTLFVADMRESLARWVPSIAVARMKVGLDRESADVKPYYLKNGNHTDPRKSVYIVPDFDGKTCVQLGWTKRSENLRAVLFGADGRELKRWEKIEDADVPALYAEVRAVLKANMEAVQARAATKTEGTKDAKPSVPLPALPPVTPPADIK